MTRLWNLLGTMPSTNARIALTLLLYAATGIVTMATGEFPGGATWAGVLVVMAGLDAAQFTAKRRTHQGNGGVVRTETVP